MNSSEATPPRSSSGTPQEGAVMELDFHLSAEPSARETQGRQSSGSSILEEGSIEEFGRTYHSYNQGAYLLPNDAQEQERLDIQHRVMSLLLDEKLAWAPIDQPKNALDVATGTGIWALEFGRKYPDCSVYGSDLSLIQPTEVVPNCYFVKEDAEADEWIFPKPFDYIHLRLVFTTFNDFDVVLRKVWDNLAPGGWVEFQDHTAEVLSTDGTTTGTALEKLGTNIARGLANVGRDSCRIRGLKARLAEMGFTDVTQHVLPHPIGTWPQDPKFKAIGKWQAHNVELGLDSITKILMAGGMSADELEPFKRNVKAEIATGEIHAYAPFYVIYARRPLAT